MKALFISDLDEDKDLLRNIFHARFSKIEFVHCSNKKEAFEKLNYQGPFSLILIECSIKEDSPSEIAKEVFDTFGEKSLIFIGTDTMINDRVEADLPLKHNMINLYKKPYDANLLSTIIQSGIEWATESEYQDSIVEIEDNDFLPIKIRNFYLFESVPFNVYIELTKTKYIQVIAADKKYTQSTIQAILQRNIRLLFIEKNEHLNFLENSMRKISINLQSKSATPRVTMQTQIAGTLVIHQYLKDVGISESVIALTESIIESIPKVYDKVGNFQDLLELFPFEHGDLAEQAILKAHFAEAISRGLGWTSDMLRRKLGLAALIHDSLLENENCTHISHLDHPDLTKLTKKELSSFIEHPKKAAELSHYFSGFTDVDFLIEQHQELPDGSGFPRGLNSNKLTQISCIFILASNFASQIALQGPSHTTFRNTLNSFSNLYDQGNFKESFKSLEKLLKR